MISALIGLALLTRSEALSCFTQSINIEGKTMTVTVVRASLDQYKVKVGLAKGLMARVQNLDAIAKRYNAVAAVNCCFFNAYSNKPYRNIDHLLITDGKVQHFANRGCAIGFTVSGTPMMGHPKWSIRGTKDHGTWYAYWLNRLPTGATTVTIYTPAWGNETNINGLQLAVDQGKVTWISRRSTQIPQHGFVVLFTNSEEKLCNHFSMGESVDYRVSFTDQDIQPWDQAEEALGCGPMLLKDGQVKIGGEDEGFTEAKIFGTAKRSFVGYTASRQVLLMSCTGTLRQEALIAKKLGCIAAMNLDGGASSGMVYQGKYVVPIGRQVATALVIIPR